MRQSSNQHDLLENLRRFQNAIIRDEDTIAGNVIMPIDLLQQIQLVCGEAADHIEWLDDFTDSCFG